VPDAAGDTPIALAMRKKNRYLVMSFHKCQLFQFLFGRPHLSHNHFANLFVGFIAFSIGVFALVLAPGIAASHPGTVLWWSLLMSLSMMLWVQNCFADPGWLQPRTIYPQHHLLGDDPARAFDAEQPVESQMVHYDSLLQDMAGDGGDLAKLEQEQNKYNYQRQLIREARKRLEEGTGRTTDGAPIPGLELQPLIGGNAELGRQQLERAAMTLQERERATGESLGRARVEKLLGLGCGEYLTLVEKGDFKQVCVVCRARRKMRSHHCK
ncbi:unnamed protein product, partial [Polarella glacialis]